MPFVLSHFTAWNVWKKDLRYFFWPKSHLCCIGFNVGKGCFHQKNPTFPLISFHYFRLKKQRKQLQRKRRDFSNRQECCTTAQLSENAWSVISFAPLTNFFNEESQRLTKDLQSRVHLFWNRKVKPDHSWEKIVGRVLQFYRNLGK